LFFFKDNRYICKHGEQYQPPGNYISPLGTISAPWEQYQPPGKGVNCMSKRTGKRHGELNPHNLPINWQRETLTADPWGTRPVP